MKSNKKARFIVMLSLSALLLLSGGRFIIEADAAQSSLSEDSIHLTGQIKESISIVHESADILYYENGSAYIHDILTNHTDKRITETEYCMLAYDEKGSPLKLHWNFLDSSAKSSYDNLVRTKENILPNQTEDYQGGWSLYGDEPSITYPLFCLKQVVFEDGTVWNNPDYDNWFATYAGKEVGTDELQNYYPYTYEMTR